MKKAVKSKNELFKQKLNLIVDEKLNALKGKVLAPRKLAEANEHLKKMKSLPK
jgi:hypothetical protein